MSTPVEEWRARWRPSWVDRLGWDEPSTGPVSSREEAFAEARRRHEGEPPGIRYERRLVIPAVYGDWESA